MKIAVIGLGYVGLPLAMVFAEAGIEVVGVEAVAARCDEINAGRSYIQDVSSDALKVVVDKGLIRATTDYAATEDCDADIICLPTPLNANREPDLTLVKDATEKLAGHLRRGQLVTLESTTYPGTTRDELAPILEAGSGHDRRRRLPPRLLARARRPRAHRLHHQEHAQGRRRSHAGLHGAGARGLRARARPRRAGEHARGRGDDQAAREHLPQRQHRADERARDALRPHGASTCGRSSTPPRPSPSAS